MKLHYLAIIAVTSIAANIGTVSAAVSIDYIGLAGCSYDVHFMSIQYPSHIISYSHFFNQIQSIRGIATSDSESTNPVLAKVELDESDLRKVEIDGGSSHRKLEKIIDEDDEDSWDEEDEDSWDYPDDVIDDIDEDEEDPDNAELALFGNEFMSRGDFSGSRNFRRNNRNFRGSRNFRRRNDFRRGRNFRRNDFRRGRGFSRNSNRFCRELYGRNFRYSSSLGDCIRM